MNVVKLELVNFRNYRHFSIGKLTNLNIIIGKNGIGKTSILEGIYFGSLTKTFKYSNESLLIKNGEAGLKVKIKVYDNIKNINLEVILSKEGKKTKINNALIRKLSDFISQYKVVVFSPDELELIKGSPNIRRNYLNIEISQIHKEYITYLNDYNTLIKNKNDYLKKMMINSSLDSKYLDILDEKIASFGEKISKYRSEYIEKINFYIKSIFKNLYNSDKLKLKYVSDFKDKDEKSILKIIRNARLKEINAGMTSVGIHRDDLEFIHNNNDAKYYSSQGLQKLIILATKLSETEILLNNYDIKPILLLDDLFSELDSLNQNKIFKSLNKDVQIFITTTDINNIKKTIVNKAKVFNIEEVR